MADAETIPANIPADMTPDLEDVIRRSAEASAELAASKALAGLDDRISRILKDVESRTDAKIDGLRTEMMDRLTELERAVAARPPSSAAPSSVSGRSSGAWVPERVEIKGFVTNWHLRNSKEGGGLPRQEVGPWLKKLEAAIASSATAADDLVDWERTRSANAYVYNAVMMIYLKRAWQHDQDAIHRLRAQVRDALDRDASLCRGVALRVVGQIPPHARPTFREGGKFMGVMRELRISVTPEWTIPFRAYASVNGTDQLLATFTEKEGWQIEQNVLREVSTHGVDDLSRLLRR